ncbi:MAG: UPF0147 family protein [Nanoarchaeota archaeon]|nr:UPF0147 family protein [Nanoarchaeota archaeon]
MTEEFTNVIYALDELRNDTGVPKSIKSKIGEMINALSNSGNDDSILVNKLLNELDDISTDINLQPFVRTQIFNISGMLETFN